MTMSTGITLSQRGSQPEDLLREADLAVYRVKAQDNGTCAVFALAMQARVQARLELESPLGQALPQGEVPLHDQPIVTLVAT